MSIIVQTIGGLGNQLFQYAFARAVSYKLKTDFFLNWVPFGTKYFKGHEYSLQHFNIKVRMAKSYSFGGFVWIKKHHRLFNAIYEHLRLRRFLFPFYYQEKSFAFDPDVFSRKGNTYFDGFWQTEKYFKDIGDELRKEISLIKPLSEYSQIVSEEIKATNAVSLHVRRADLVFDPEMNAFHGICSLDYYKKAVAYVTDQITSPHFFIFSDDYEWAVENFKFLQHPYTCIKNGADKNYEDITLMSKCKHHIIANSSFSWWGAWLNPSAEKIVIAPKRWFANAPKADIKDLIPDNWIKI